jgi:hypothetical protein
LARIANRLTLWAWASTSVGGHSSWAKEVEQTAGDGEAERNNQQHGGDEQRGHSARIGMGVEVGACDTPTKTDQKRNQRD